MELNAVTRSVGDIFSVSKRYLVPRFQREYSWTSEEISEFWDDLVQQISVKKHGKSVKIVHDEYFIGCIVLVGEDSKRDYLIVDGQQRLTTLTILLRAIVERLDALGDTSAAQALFGNVIEGVDDEGEKYFKLINETPKPFFQNEIQAFDKESLNPPETEEEVLLQSAFDNFLSRLSGISMQGMSELDSIKAIRDQTLRYLKFILVTAKHEEEAYTIFETLNARGLNLTSVDLIKNWIFKNFPSKHPSDHAKNIWSEIRTKVAELSDLESFFRHYWSSKYAYASNDRLYKSFNDHRKSGAITNARDFLLELKAASERYRKICQPRLSDWKTQKEKSVVRHLDYINQYKVTQVRPFLLALLHARENGYIDETTFTKVIHNLENFHLIFSNICKTKASGLEGTYTRAAKNLYLAGVDKKKVKAEMKSLMQTLNAKLPSPEKISYSINSLRFTKENDAHKKTIQAIFSKIESNLQKTSELKIGNFSLEHIEDQSSEHEWVGEIGNLIPLAEKINNELKASHSFKLKKDKYKKSKLEIVKTFVETNPQDTWSKTRADKWKNEIITLLTDATKLFPI